MNRTCPHCKATGHADTATVCRFCTLPLETPEEAFISSQPTLDVYVPDQDEEDEYTRGGILAAALCAQVWGPDGLDPVDESSFLAAMVVLGEIDDDDIEEAFELVEDHVPEDAAEALLERRDDLSAASLDTPGVALSVDAPPGASVFTLALSVTDAFAQKAEVDVRVEEVGGLTVRSVGRNRKSLGKSRSVEVQFQVGSPGGAKIVKGFVNVRLTTKGEIARVYEAPFQFRVEGDRPIITRYDINVDGGILRWNQNISGEAADAELDGTADGSTKITNDGGKVEADVAARGSLEVNNVDGITQLKERGRPGRRRNKETATPATPLFVVPDLAATVELAIAAEVERRRQLTGGTWLGPSDDVHNAFLAWKDGAGRQHAADLIGIPNASFGRHHRQADVPVRPAADTRGFDKEAAEMISRRAVEVVFPGRQPYLRRVGQSPVSLDDAELGDHKKKTIPAEGAEVTWLQHDDLEIRWKVRVVGIGASPAVRFTEPSGRVCHVVAPGGGALGGSASLLPLPPGPGDVEGVGLLRNGDSWWLRGADGGLLVDGRPRRHPELHYGLRDRAVVRLACGTEVEFHVGRSEAGEDWEIRDVFSQPEDNLPELKRLLGHVVHP